MELIRDEIDPYFGGTISIAGKIVRKNFHLSRKEIEKVAASQGVHLTRQQIYDAKHTTLVILGKRGVPIPRTREDVDAIMARLPKQMTLPTMDENPSTAPKEAPQVHLPEVLPEPLPKTETLRDLLFRIATKTGIRETRLALDSLQCEVQRFSQNNDEEKLRAFCLTLGLLELQSTLKNLVAQIGALLNDTHA